MIGYIIGLIGCWMLGDAIRASGESALLASSPSSGGSIARGRRFLRRILGSCPCPFQAFSFGRLCRPRLAFALVSNKVGCFLERLALFCSRSAISVCRYAWGCRGFALGDSCCPQTFGEVQAVTCHRTSLSEQGDRKRGHSSKPSATCLCGCSPRHQTAQPCKPNLTHSVLPFVDIIPHGLGDCK